MEKGGWKVLCKHQGLAAAWGLGHGEVEAARYVASMAWCLLDALLLWGLGGEACDRSFFLLSRRHLARELTALASPWRGRSSSG